MLFALFIVAIILSVYLALRLINNMVAYVAMCIVSLHKDSTITRINGDDSWACLILPFTIAFIVWYCWTY